MVVRIVVIATFRISYYHCLNFLFIIIANLITIFVCFLLDVNEYSRDVHYYDDGLRIPMYKKRTFVMSSCPRAMCVLMTLNGDILDTVYCENEGELNGRLLDIRFCALCNTSVITHEVRDEGQHIVKRKKTGEVTMTCDLFNIQPRNGGIVCTSVGIILILDINNVIHFMNDTGNVESSMCLEDLKILYAERLFLDKHDRVWIKGKHEDGTHDGGVYITGLSK